MSDNRDAILEIVGKAYQIETDGYTFYSMTAERATKPAVQELFSKLASDEVQHQAFLKSVAKNYDEKGVAAFRFDAKVPDARSVTLADLHRHVPRTGRGGPVRDWRCCQSA